MVGTTRAPYLFGELEVSFEFPLTFRLAVADDGRDHQNHQYSLHFGSGRLPPTSSITRLEYAVHFLCTKCLCRRTDDRNAVVRQTTARDRTRPLFDYSIPMPFSFRRRVRGATQGKLSCAG